MEKSRVHSILKKVRKNNPIVYYFAAIHEAFFTANGLLALGATPLISGAIEETDEALRKADAVILKMDQSEYVAEKLLTAAKSAYQHKIPTIFDSSGVCLSIFRKEVSRQILREIKVSIIHGTPLDIAFLIGEKWERSMEENNFLNQNESELALLAAKRLDTTIVISGKEQIVSDGISTYSIHNWDPLLTKVAGSSSLLSAVIGTSAAVEENLLEAIVSGLLFNGVAAEIAANKTEGQGPGSFQIEFLNQLSLISSSELDLYGSFTKYEI
jgi:hydroxyethylthiazole kinase